MPASKLSGPTTFAWITGERTNVGDSLLRRPYLRATRTDGPVIIWIRRSGQDFLEGIDPGAGDRLFRSFLAWYVRLLGAALTRRTMLVLNPGEFRVRPFGALLLAPIAVAVLVVRIHGGRTVWLGVSVPPGGPRLMRVWYRLVFRSVDFVAWRDTTSDSIDVRATMPDWGFAEAPAASATAGVRERNLAAFVLRGDRALPEEAWFDWARGLCEKLELDPIVVVQVRQDAERAFAVAERLGGEVLEWAPGLGHRQQEERLRSVYAMSSIVIGDRLHGLIIGASEGAVPLGWVPTSGGKIRRHFSMIGFEPAWRYEGAAAHGLPCLAAEDIEIERARLENATTGARRKLAALANGIEALWLCGDTATLASYGRRSARSRASRNAAE